MPLISSFLASLLFLLGTAAVVPTADPPASKMDNSWAARLPKDDRQSLDLTLGYEAPEIPEDIEWIGKNPGTLEELRGKVVLLQTFTTRNTLGRNTPKKLFRTLKPLEENPDFVVVLLHTPEGANKAERYCERVKMPYPVALDTNGQFCDQIGAFKRPVNVLIGRSGEIKYAGLNEKGILAAGNQLLKETYDPTMTPTPRPEPEIQTEGFPRFTNALASSADLRGKQAPPFYVNTWITQRPDGANKVAVIDFWATWCGPCVKAIPHMNDLQSEFKNDVVCIGISDEQPQAFQTGLQNRSLGPANMHYALALDPSGQMKKSFAIRGIPHVAVISSDWVVRWQGHPSSLSSDVLGSIVKANKGMLNRKGNNAGPGMPPARWQNKS